MSNRTFDEVAAFDVKSMEILHMTQKTYRRASFKCKGSAIEYIGFQRIKESFEEFYITKVHIRPSEHVNK